MRSILTGLNALFIMRCNNKQLGMQIHAPKLHYFIKKRQITASSAPNQYKRFDNRSYQRDNYRTSYQPTTHRQQQSATTPPLTSSPDNTLLYGVSPVLSALQANRRKLHTLFIQDGINLAKRKDKAAVIKIQRLAQEHGLAITYASKHDLNMAANNRPHQGLMLECSPLEFIDMDAFPSVGRGEEGEQEEEDEKEEKGENREKGETITNTTSQQRQVWLCLDEVVDPQNFGAILRSAFFLGASGVLTCSRNSAPLSAVVSKASSGAMELMPVYSAQNLITTLEDAKVKGWRVLGAAAERNAVPCHQIHNNNGPVILVVGNEGYGLRTTIKRVCDGLVKIQGGGNGGGIDSLNVSVATGILLHQLMMMVVEEEIL